MKTVKFTRNVLVTGEHREAGSTLEVTDEMATEIVAGCYGELVTDEPAADEPAAKKAKK